MRRTHPCGRIPTRALAALAVAFLLIAVASWVFARIGESEAKHSRSQSDRDSLRAVVEEGRRDRRAIHAELDRLAGRIAAIEARLGAMGRPDADGAGRRPMNVGPDDMRAGEGRLDRE